jgi:hypothetical protein
MKTKVSIREENRLRIRKTQLLILVGESVELFVISPYRRVWLDPVTVGMLFFNVNV